MPVPLGSCPYCGSNDIDSVWPESNFDHCRSCLLYFRNPMPTPQELERLYQHSWSMPETARSETGGTSDRLAYVYARKLARSLGRGDLRGLRILDFGAGRGAMLEALRSLGARACGVEPFGFEYLQSKGFEAYRALSDVQGALDGIVMIDVFEHLYNPWETLHQLGGMLAQGAWIYLATANPLGLNARINKGRWREARKGGHLLFPHPSTMERILREAGFEWTKRLKWLIRYHQDQIRITVNYLMQAVGLDGELRYLAWR